MLEVAGTAVLSSPVDGNAREVADEIEQDAVMVIDTTKELVVEAACALSRTPPPIQMGISRQTKTSDRYRVRCME